MFEQLLRIGPEDVIIGISFPRYSRRTVSAMQFAHDRGATAIALTDSAKQFIVENGYDPVYGARPLKRYLQKHVETLAARLILSDGVRAGDVIQIDEQNGKLTASAVHAEE